jgi:hypothetical protein
MNGIRVLRRGARWLTHLLPFNDIARAAIVKQKGAFLQL